MKPADRVVADQSFFPSVRDLPKLDKPFVILAYEGAFRAEVRQVSSVRGQEEVGAARGSRSEVFAGRLGKHGLDLFRPQPVNPGETGPAIGRAEAVGDQSSAVRREDSILDGQVDDGPCGLLFASRDAPELKLPLSRDGEQRSVRRHAQHACLWITRERKSGCRRQPPPEAGHRSHEDRADEEQPAVPPQPGSRRRHVDHSHR